ncbi:MAG TPA: response regulator [Kofleriaceae bacterium]|nr:response regulator [Kofleriaceae bacterium]
MKLEVLAAAVAVPSRIDTPHPARAARAADRASRRILVVEDDAELRESLAESLALRGYQVDTVVDGRAALDRMRQTQPDIVVLDLLMPVMDGWQFRAEQKRDPALADTPVVVISGSDSPTAAAVDADLCLRKPLDPTALVDAIEGVLRTEERRREPARLAQSERMAALGTLAAGMAHEINNPLTYVLLFLAQAKQLLRRAGGQLDAVGLDQLDGLLSGAIEGAERIRGITSGIRAFSRLDEDRRVPIDVRTAIDDAVRLVSHEIRQRARLICDLGDCPPVLGSEGRLGQVFINLLTNAFQALPPGQASAHEIRIQSGTDENGWAVVEIADTGTGIPDHLIGRIFEPFFTTKPVGEGTGLGLSISHGIVRSLGGELQVASRVGSGTTFRVRLPPTTPAPIPGRRPPPAAAAAAGPRRRVLVVDDEPAVGSALARVLSTEHDVATASSGLDALALLARDTRFDVILCDLHMPDMTGMELHAELERSQPDLARRMIFMTGGAFTEESRRFIEAPGRRLLTKPIDLDAIRSLIATD